MELQTKHKVAAFARRYIQEKGLSQGALARRCGINPSYLSNILGGSYDYKASGQKSVAIADKYFTALAEAVGCGIGPVGWDILPTPQFSLGIATLESAHRNATSEGGRGAVKMIVGQTGSGKTTFIRQYCKAHPVGTFVVTINDYDQVYDIIGEIAKQLGIELPAKRGARLRAVGAELRRRALEGEQNILILDEGENTKVPGLKAYKAIYDMVQGYCAFVIAATDELPRMLERLAAHRTPGIRQFARRFKAYTVVLPPVDRSFAQFLDPIADAGLRQLLRGLCDNYGELHDYLDEARHRAFLDGVELTEEYFRTIHAIAKTNTSNR